VAQHQPCFRIALEYTTKHEPQCVRRSLECPTANRTPKFRMPGIHCRVIHWIGGMKIDRRFKRRGALSPYSASEVTSLGSRFYVQMDWICKHWPVGSRTGAVAGDTPGIQTLAASSEVMFQKGW
jgi:hypothetical protein